MKPRVACSLLLLLLVAGCASGPVGPLVALTPPDVTGPHARSGWATEIWVGPDALGVRYPALHRDRLDGVPADQPSLVPLADGRLAAEDVEEGKAPALRAALDAHAARVRAGLVGRAAEPSAAVHLDAATPLATLGVVLRTAAEAGMHRVQLVLARRAADLTMPMAASGPPSDAPHDKVDLLLSRVDGGWMAALSERPAGQPLLVPRSPDVLATIPLHLVPNPAICPSVPLDASGGPSPEAAALVGEAVCGHDNEPYGVVVRAGPDTPAAEIAAMLAAATPVGVCRGGPLALALQDAAAGAPDCADAIGASGIEAALADRAEARKAAGHEADLKPESILNQVGD